jgi:hypothetical protein
VATVQENILGAFYAKLAKAGVVHHETIDALRGVLTDRKKLKSEELVAILVKEPAGGAKP